MTEQEEDYWRSIYRVNERIERFNNSVGHLRYSDTMGNAIPPDIAVVRRVMPYIGPLREALASLHRATTLILSSSDG